MVYHLDELGEKQIILVVSGSFDRVQRKWSQAEHEAFGVLKVITTAAPFLLGRHFFLNTDARNLTFLSSDNTKKIYRWFMQLLPYHFTINHIPGKYNTMADNLSRMQQQDLLHGEVHRDQPYRNEVTVGNMVLNIADGDDEKAQVS